MKNKTCLICHTAIDTSKEFCIFKHHKNDKEIKSKAYYHVNCFSDKISGLNTQKKLANSAMEIVNKLNGKIIELE